MRMMIPLSLAMGNALTSVDFARSAVVLGSAAVLSSSPRYFSQTELFSAWDRLQAGRLVRKDRASSLVGGRAHGTSRP